MDRDEAVISDDAFSSQTDEAAISNEVSSRDLSPTEGCGTLGKVSSEGDSTSALTALATKIRKPRKSIFEIIVKRSKMLRCKGKGSTSVKHSSVNSGIIENGVLRTRQDWLSGDVIRDRVLDILGEKRQLSHVEPVQTTKRVNFAGLKTKSTSSRLTH